MNLLSLKKSRITTIVICLLIISSISVAFKLSHVDFTEPSISEDVYVYILAAFSIINGDFSQPDTKPLGWSILLSPFYLFDDSTDLLHYVNIARILSIAISTITILPMYILARRFFDEKYSLVASCLFAFEPHLINNSTLGLSEPLFILAIILTSIFILQKNHSWYFYMSFLLAGITWWIRVNGLITLVILSIIFFIVYKSSSKNFVKYLLCIVIFVLVASPMLIQKYDQFGDPLYFAISDNYFAGDQKHFALNTKYIEYSASDYIQDNGIIGFLERFGLTGLGNMASSLLKMLFPYLIILVPFGILFSLRSFAQDKDYIKSIWVLMLITLGSVVIQFSIVSDMRFIYHTFPFLIILSTITIQRVVKYGLSTFSFSEKQKNFFLVSVICVVIILSGTFTLKVDTPDKLLNQERIEFTEILTKNFGGKVIGVGDSIRLLTYTQLYDSPNLFKEFKTSTYDFVVGGQSNIFAHGMERIVLYAESLDELIQIGKEYDLKYIVINENANTDKIIRYPYLTNLYDEGEKYPFLTKVLDTKEIGFKKFKVKVFEINYDKFITNET